MRSAHQTGLDARLQTSLCGTLAAKRPTLSACGRTTRNEPSPTTACSSRSANSRRRRGRAGIRPGRHRRRVHQHPLDLSLMRASLRGYQAFGAKFALCQERAMLGDEMGLGKTVEALAAMCHLHVEGRRHFLVVCPASVLVNWTHEIRRHSELRVLPAARPRPSAELPGLDSHRRHRRNHLRLPSIAAQDCGHRPRHAGRRRGALREEPGGRAHQGGQGLGEDNQPGPVPHRHSDGKPGRGIPGPGQPSSARPAAARQ